MISWLKRRLLVAADGLDVALGHPVYPLCALVGLCPWWTQEGVWPVDLCGSVQVDEYDRVFFTPWGRGDGYFYTLHNFDPLLYSSKNIHIFGEWLEKDASIRVRAVIPLEDKP